MSTARSLALSFGTFLNGTRICKPTHLIAMRMGEANDAWTNIRDNQIYAAEATSRSESVCTQL